MPRLEIIEADRLDYGVYADFLRRAYRDLLEKNKASDAFMTPDFYRWKYRTPAGLGRVALIKEGDEILSSSAMIPYHLKDDAGSLVGWHCLDVATIPPARRKGHFFATLKGLFDALPREGLVFAFPNAASIPSFLNLGCRAKQILTTWINPCAVLTGAHSPRVLKCEGIPLDTFSQDLETKAPAVRRDQDYLRWRYAEHPNNAYHYFLHEYQGDRRGYAVARLASVFGRDFALVMELWGRSWSDRVRILRSVAAWAVQQGKKMLFMMNTDFSFGEGLASGFAAVPSFLLPKKQVLVVYPLGAPAERFLHQRWKLQTGDWDVF